MTSGRRREGGGRTKGRRVFAHLWRREPPGAPPALALGRCKTRRHLHGICGGARHPHVLGPVGASWTAPDAPDAPPTSVAQCGSGIVPRPAALLRALRPSLGRGDDVAHVAPTEGIVVIVPSPASP